MVTIVFEGAYHDCRSEKVGRPENASKERARGGASRHELGDRHKKMHGCVEMLKRHDAGVDVFTIACVLNL